jgi:hypothetical protein
MRAAPAAIRGSEPTQDTLLPRPLWLGAAALLLLAGLVLRAQELGTWALSNDEAWVALSTRVEGIDQFWLAIAMTPVGWAGLLKLVQVSIGSTEAVLRSVPLVFGCLTMWMAYVAGRRFAGHPLGGVLALAAVAFDPLSIAYAKVLKQYTAEAFFCLLAFVAAARVAERGRHADLALFAGVLVVGLAFANSQLFLGPPLFGALAFDAVLRRDGKALREIVATALVVGLCGALFYVLLLAPRLPLASNPYWASQLYLPISIDAPGILWKRLEWTLEPMLGRFGLILAGLLLVATAFAVQRRVVVLGLALLVLECAVLSMLGILALSQPRILLFLTTALGAYGAASFGLVSVAAWRQPALGAVAALALLLVAYQASRSRDVRTAGTSKLVEDVGRLVPKIEAARQENDAVLVHKNSLFVYAYYRRAIPILVPFSLISVGYLPRLDDDKVRIVDDGDVLPQLREALRASPRAWLLASRLKPSRERRLRERVAEVAEKRRDLRRPSAFLLLLTPRVPSPAGAGTGRIPRP